jgi:hypothetical protein
VAEGVGVGGCAAAEKSGGFSAVAEGVGAASVVVDRSAVAEISEEFAAVAEGGGSVGRKKKDFCCGKKRMVGMRMMAG